MLFYTADSHITNFIFVAADLHSGRGKFVFNISRLLRAAADFYASRGKFMPLHQQAFMPPATSHSRPITAADIKRPHICRN